MTYFKPLENSEIDLIVSMMKDFYAIDNYPLDENLSKQLFEKFIADENLGKAWLIYFKEEIIGYVITTFFFSFEYQGKTAFLDELYIKKEYRQKGIGHQTIQFIKKESHKLSLKLIYLEVESHNISAQKLYIANDFEIHNRKIMKLKIK